MPRYTLDAGRCIVLEGKPLATLHGVTGHDGVPYDPTAVDALAREIVAALNGPHNDGTNAATAEEIQEARDLYTNSEDIEVDDNAITSQTDDGTWVQGWLWVSLEEEIATDETRSNGPRGTR